jgi:hypothetical protein
VRKQPRDFLEPLEGVEHPVHLFIGQRLPRRDVAPQDHLGQFHPLVAGQADVAGQRHHLDPAVRRRSGVGH